MLCSDSELVSNNSGGVAADVSFNLRKITKGKIGIFHKIMQCIPMMCLFSNIFILANLLAGWKLMQLPTLEVYCFEVFKKYLLEKFLDTSIVVKIAPFNFLLALNFFKQSTVSCLK